MKIEITCYEQQDQKNRDKIEKIVEALKNAGCELKKYGTRQQAFAENGEMILDIVLEV